MRLNKIYNSYKKEGKKTMKEKMKEILKYKRVKYFGIAVILLIFTIALNIAFSSFLFRDTTAVANIKVAGMEYVMKVDGNSTRIVKGNANDVTVVEVEITATNKYASKYELIYKVCTTASCAAYVAIPADFEVQYHEDTESSITGEVSKNGVKTITIAIINDTASDVWIELDINAGYTHNTLTLASLIINEYIMPVEDLDQGLEAIFYALSEYHGPHNAMGNQYDPMPSLNSNAIFSGKSDVEISNPATYFSGSTGGGNIRDLIAVNTGRAEDIQNVGIRFIGLIDVPQAGTYKFKVIGDDGMVLKIDGTTVFDHWIADWDWNDSISEGGSEIALTAGFHSFVLDYSQGWGGAMIDIKWKLNNGTFTYIPDSAFSFVKATNFSIDETTTINVGGSTQIMSNFIPSNTTNKNILWSSSNESVVTVDVNGIITGVTVGNTTITAKALGSGITQTCTVTVSAG